MRDGELGPGRGLCSGLWMRPRSFWREMFLLDESKASSNSNSIATLIRKTRSDCDKMILGVGTEGSLMNAIKCDYADVPNDKISYIFLFTLSLPIDIPCKLTRSSHPRAACPQSHDLAFLLHTCIACDGFRLGTYVIVYSHSREVWTPVRAYGDCARYWIKPLNTWP